MGGGRRLHSTLTSVFLSFCPPPLHPQYSPPLIPPRGEVNAADAFDIGSFDEEDTKGIKVRASPCTCERTCGRLPQTYLFLSRTDFMN